MTLKKHILFFTFAISFVSCSLFKKPQETAKETIPEIGLDTVKVSANPPEPMHYQPSATRVTDIIHTKLEVNFDWAKQWMYGKATITAKPYFYSTSTMVLDARGMEIKQIALINKEIITTVSTPVKKSKKKIVEPVTSYDTIVIKFNLM